MSKIPKSIILRRKLKDCSGFKLNEKNNQFSLTKYIFSENYKELQIIIENQVESNKAYRLSKEVNKEDFENLQFQTLRLLHNFIASAQSLIDHTRNYVNDVYKENNSFKSEYQNKVEKVFIKNKTASFIISFRQYLQHYKTPKIATISSLTEKPEDLNTRIIIEKKDLEDFSGWRSLAKEYISELNEHLNLKNLIEDYHQLVSDFYEWFSKRQSNIHKLELEEMRKINKEMLIAQIEELFHNYLHNNNFSTEIFNNEIIRYMGEFEKSVFMKSNKKLKLEYLLSICENNNFGLKETDILHFKEKYYC